MKLYKIHQIEFIYNKDSKETFIEEADTNSIMKRYIMSDDLHHFKLQRLNSIWVRYTNNKNLDEFYCQPKEFLETVRRKYL